MTLVLDIGTIRIDAQGNPEDAERFETTLRAALDLLADKLSHSAFARDPQAMGIALRSLQIDDLTQDDWTGARGAARVAEVLFQQITEHGGQHG